MDRIEVVPGLDPELLGRVVGRLRELEPSTVALLVSGSYAKETVDESSDLDITVVLEGEPSSPYRMWFEERPGASPLHVSPGFCSLERCIAEREQAEDWALGFPVLNLIRYLWATEAARAALGDPPSYVHPPAAPELEDFVEALTKVRRSAAAGDGLGTRVFARAAGELAPGLLRALNGNAVVSDRREAYAAALGLAIVPEHYQDDFAISVGLAPAVDEVVAEAALRLGSELLALLRMNRPDADTQPDIARYLSDGTLERHLGFLD